MSNGVLEHRRFLVFGAARSGLAAARLLRRLGKEVLMYDEAPSAKLDDALRQSKQLGVPLLTAADEKPPLRAWDVLVLSPGIPTTHPFVKDAVAAGCLVRSELEIGYLACPAPILAVTGTNGKTTTTHLVAHLFEGAGRPAAMAGNVGRALCEAVLDERVRLPGAVVVCEVSSFQLETVERFRPRVAAILNVTPDHLERYATMDAYAAAKLRISENQEGGDAFVLNADCPYCRSLAPRSRAGVWWFSVKETVQRGAYLDRDALWTVAGRGKTPRQVMPRSEIPLVGLHNVENVLAALAMACAAGLDAASLAPRVRTFRAVPHRIELVATIDGVRYYNDSKATNLDSLEKALQSFAGPIVLIAGGRDKGAPWTRLSDLVARRVKGLVLIGEAAPIGRAAWAPLVARAEDAADMEDAVRRARSMAAPGDAVLLSPACASYDMYRNYEERGDHFRSIVLQIARGGRP